MNQPVSRTVRRPAKALREAAQISKVRRAKRGMRCLWLWNLRWLP